MASTGDIAPHIFERLAAGILKPGLLVSVSYYYNLRTFVLSPLLVFRDAETFRHRAFSGLWATLGGLMSQDLHGDVPERLKSASGVVLDLGPGTGEMLKLFDPERITKVYGVEPAVDMHPVLQANIEKYGLSNKYDILTCGGEPESLIPALDKHGLLEHRSEGVFDTILCVRVLCGVPNLQGTINELYKLLKPGGRLIFYEHIASPWPNRGSIFGYILQKFWYLLGWNLVMGGCKINRDTVSALKKAGSGQDEVRRFDVNYWDTWNSVPFVVGEMVKA